MTRYEIEIEGVTALLMHRNSMVEDDGKINVGGKAGDDRYPVNRWTRSVYVEGGVVAIPSVNLSACFEKAGAKISLGRMQTGKLAAALIDIGEPEEPWLPLLVGTKRQTVGAEAIEAAASGKTFADQVKATQKIDQAFTLDVRPAKIGKSMHVRVRPRFMPWALKTTIDVEDEALKPHLPTLFQIAGLRVGLLDYRPGSPTRPGPFGRFKVTMR